MRGIFGFTIEGRRHEVFVWSHDDTYWGVNAANDDGGLGYIHLHKDRYPTEQEAAERAIAHFGGDVPEQTKR